MPLYGSNYTSLLYLSVLGGVFFFFKVYLCQCKLFFCFFVVWFVERNMHIYLQCWQYIFHSENMTIVFLLVAFYLFLTVINGHLNYLKVDSIYLKENYVKDKY